MTTKTLALALAAMGPMKSRNVQARGRRTTVKLDPVFWQALALVSEREGLSEHQIVVLVEKNRRAGASLTSSLRAFLLGYALELASA